MRDVIETQIEKLLKAAITNNVLLKLGLIKESVQREDPYEGARFLRALGYWLLGGTLLVLTRSDAEHALTTANYCGL